MKISTALPRLYAIVTLLSMFALVIFMFTINWAVAIVCLIIGVFIGYFIALSQVGI